MSNAPTSSAISRKRFQSITREYAEAPATISFGLCSCASARACVVVDALGLGVEAVGDDVEPLAREVDRRAVRQVAAVRQGHAEDRVAGLERREVDRLVGLRAGVRLHVGVLGAEELLRALDRERLDDVDELAAAVVALAGIAFGVLVGELRCPARPAPPGSRSSPRRSARYASSCRRFSACDGGPELGIGFVAA